MKTIRKELPAIAKRASELLIKDILKKTKMPKLPKHQQGFISVIIYAGIVDESNGTFFYPEPTEEYRLEEV